VTDFLEFRSVRLAGGRSETEYRVHGDAPFTLKIGTASHPLYEAHQRQNVACSAFITAFNPYGQTFDETQNLQRNATLRAELVKGGRALMEGIGQHPSNDWPGENSFLVFGVLLEDAKTLGTSFQQNAIVWTGADSVPQLVLLR